MNYAWAQNCDKTERRGEGLVRGWDKCIYTVYTYIYIPSELFKPLAKDEPKSCKSEQLISNQGR